MSHEQYEQNSITAAYPHADLNWSLISQLRELDKDFEYVNNESIEQLLEKIADPHILIQKVLELLIHDDATITIYSSFLDDPDVPAPIEFDAVLGLRGLDNLRVRLQLEIFILEYLARHGKKAFFLDQLKAMAVELEKYKGDDKEDYIAAARTWEVMKNEIDIAVTEALGEKAPRFYTELESWENLFV